MPSRKRRLPVGSLTVDRSVQRQAYVEATLAQLRADFDPDLLGLLQVSHRDDDTMVLLDGAHRSLVAEEMRGPEFMVDCKVYTGLTRPQEARIFKAVNLGKPPSRVDDFVVLVTAENPDALAVRDAVRRSGIGEIGPAKHQIKAVATLMGIVKRGNNYDKEEGRYGAVLLYNVLYVAARAWGDKDLNATNPSILKALTTLLLGVERYQDKFGVDLSFSLDRLADNIRAYGEGPTVLYSSARQVRGMGKQVSGVLLDSLFVFYNRGKGGRKLTEEFQLFVKKNPSSA